MKKAAALAFLCAVGWCGSARAAIPWQHFFDASLDDTTCPFNIEVQISLDFFSQTLSGRTELLLRGTYTLTDLENGHTLVSTIHQTQFLDLATGNATTLGVQQMVRDGNQIVAKLVGRVVYDPSGNVLSESGQDTLPVGVAPFCALVQGP
jgi:hypothetical protein